MANASVTVDSNLGAARGSSGTVTGPSLLVGGETNNNLGQIRQQQQTFAPGTNISNNNNDPSSTATNTANTTPHELQSLPLDALHCIASFLTPSDWCNRLGLTHKAAHAQCQQIVRRVRLHGFKCATEIIAAWKVGQAADARELAALYVANGVPIYPRCLGHSYQTVCWRMKVEANEQHQHQQNNNNSTNTDDTAAEQQQQMDPFYERLQFRASQEMGRAHTYVEEKSIFYANKHSLLETRSTSTSRAGSMSSTTTSATVNRGRFSPGVVAAAADEESNTTAISSSSTSGNNNNNEKDNDTPEEEIPTTPKVIMPVHQHLLDQHRLGEYSVDDKHGSLSTPLISLSADFYHPPSHMSAAALERKAARERRTVVPTAPSPPPPPPPPPLAIDDTLVDIHEALRLGGAAGGGPQPPADASDIEDAHSLMAPHPALATALQVVEPEGYSASQATTKSPEDFETLELRKHMRSRFATYQRRLEGFIAKRDLVGFEECLLDLWDEFFPHTAGIHYHDTETAVPRISCLHKFLTKPCPKAIGVVQCEIERIKINPRGKGVNVKGSVFPKYEYRLFIRDRSAAAAETPADGDESAPSPSENPPSHGVRRDTVLMVAKNRGRKHAELNGALPAVTTAASSRKGSNNYYLYMPQQRDVDAHYSKANGCGEGAARWVPNGASHEPVLASDDAGSVLLGRLQSNFFGTEFQIFTPRLRTLPRPKSEPPCFMQQRMAVSEDELDYDSGVSSDNGGRSGGGGGGSSGGGGRSKRFGRLSRRRSRSQQQHHHNHSSSSAASDHLSIGSNSSAATSVLDRPMVKRALSSPDISSARQPRTNRRAIANDAAKPATLSSSLSSHHPTTVMVEEEDGAITYTATILGSRPRIMDVVIPKVTADGVAGLEWKEHLERALCEEHNNSNNHQADSSMLNCFRQMQQRLEQAAANNNINNAQQQQDNNNNQEANGDPQQQQEQDNNESGDDFGLMALQNRPPWWNVELGSFVLNFGGRVSVASVKNFQLCEPTDHDTIILQFGRINGRHSFTMDFQHPLSAVQAFSIAISSLQSKISFG